MDLNVTFTTEAVKNDNVSDPTGFVPPAPAVGIDDDGGDGPPTGGLGGNSGGTFGPTVLGTGLLEELDDGTNQGYTSAVGAFDNGGTDFSGGGRGY